MATDICFGWLVACLLAEALVIPGFGGFQRLFDLVFAPGFQASFPVLLQPQVVSFAVAVAAGSAAAVLVSEMVSAAVGLALISVENFLEDYSLAVPSVGLVYFVAALSLLFDLLTPGPACC